MNDFFHSNIVEIATDYMMIKPIFIRNHNSQSLAFSLTHEGIARVDYLHWDAFHEGENLSRQVEDYRSRY